MKYLMPLAALIAVIALAGCGGGTAGNQAAAETVTVEKTVTDPDKAEEAPEYTTAQENAIAFVEGFLDYAPLSRKGLLELLSAEYGEGFSKADAIFAVNHMDVNWNEQAAKSAKAYLDSGSFTRQSLIEQLEFGEGFTHAQAVYGVNQTGL